MERLSGVHFGAVYTVLKGYRSIGRLLDSVNRRAKRRGGSFIWLLLQANEVQLLFVDSRSHPEVISWLDSEPYFDRVATMPTWVERNQWLEKGLEKMEETMQWKNKVRYSKKLFSGDGDGDNVTNTRSESITSPLSDNSPPTNERANHGEYERIIVPHPIEEVVRRLEEQGYSVQWLSEEGYMAFVIPPRGGPI